ncbi:MAG TPA: thioredoxin-disulfide reductase [Chloroflexota bacterium]|nr:thioredoxin-disulfide reductase [Chloroflexota bacterium]
MTTEPQKLIIIGSGPAGYTAALYAARANLAPLVFAGSQNGGQLMLTTEVENYPGFVAGVMGPELMETFRAQAERFGADIRDEDVTAVDLSHRPFVVETEDGRFYAHSVIIATGASARWLGLESETRLRGRGVSTCATCDGAFFRNKEIAVVGGGDSAMEEATFLTRFATKVTLIHRRDHLRASKAMQDRALANPKINFIWNSEVVEVLGQQAVSGLVLRDTVTGALSEIAVSGLFVAIGHHPNTELVQGQIDTDEAGYIQIGEHSLTNIPGVFAAGDVRDTRYKQAITAAGDGCKAALDAEKYLEEHGLGIEPSLAEAEAAVVAAL